MKTVKNREYSFNHFKKRLKQRYRLEINRLEYEKLCSQIKNTDKKPIGIEKQKDGLQKVYSIIFGSTILKVVWSEKRQCITTILPKEGLHIPEVKN